MGLTCTFIASKYSHEGHVIAEELYLVVHVRMSVHVIKNFGLWQYRTGRGEKLRILLCLVNRHGNLSVPYPILTFWTSGNPSAKTISLHLKTFTTNLLRVERGSNIRIKR